MPDGNFEQNLGTLVDTQVSEKLPSLMDYRIGFQIIDKNEDNTRAVGVSGFIVNGQWIYIPVFFIDNDLKGMNLMFLVDKDIFVPALDTWIGALNDAGAGVLGEMATDEESNATSFKSPSESEVYVDGSISKTAGLEKYASSDIEKYAFGPNSIIDKETWGKMCKKASVELIKNGPDLLHDLEHRLPKEAGEVFVNTFLNNPEFSNALFAFYTPDQLHKTASAILEKTAHADTFQGQHPRKLEVIGDRFCKEAAELKDSEKSVLMTNGMYIKDDRDNHSVVYRKDAKDHQLENPSRPGIYDALMDDGSFKTFAILLPTAIKHCMPKYLDDRGEYPKGAKVCMVDISSPKKFFEVKACCVFCKPARDSFRMQFERAEGGTKASLRSMKPLGNYTNIMISNGPGQSIRTQIRQSGGSVIKVSSATSSVLDGDDGDNEICFTDKGKLSLHGGIIYVPSTARVFVKDYHPKHKFGTPKVVPTTLIMQNGLHKVAVYGGSGTYEVQSDIGSYGALTKEAAARHLCADMGIYAGTAMEYIKEADRNGTTHFFVKYAAGYGSSSLDSNIWEGGPNPRHEDAVTEKVNSAPGKTHSSMLPAEAVSRAEKATQAGVKEVFDVSVLQPLIDKADVSELRRDYITDMVKAMDRLGRMLFLYYWHNDEFEAKFGKEQMTELESTLEEVFHNLGDLVLFLKEKTLYNPDSPDNIFGNMSEGLATSNSDGETGV